MNRRMFMSHTLRFSKPFLLYLIFYEIGMGDKLPRRQIQTHLVKAQLLSNRTLFKDLQ